MSVLKRYNTDNAEKAFTLVFPKFKEKEAFSCPVGLVFGTEEHIYLLGKIEYENDVAEYNSDTKKYDSLDIGKDTITAIRFNKTKSKWSSPADLLVAKELLPFEGKSIKLRAHLNDEVAEIWDSLKIANATGKHLTIDEVTTSDDYAKILNEYRVRIATAAVSTNKGGYKAISPTERLRQKLEFVKGSKEEIANEAVALAGAIALQAKYDDSICAALDNEPEQVGYMPFDASFIEAMILKTIETLLA